MILLMDCVALLVTFEMANSGHKDVTNKGEKTVN
jgi:hypothetical protein